MEIYVTIIMLLSVLLTPVKPVVTYKEYDSNVLIKSDNILRKYVPGS